MSGGTQLPVVASIEDRLDRLRRFAGRRAYLWRDGVRWRSRTYGELLARSQGAATAFRAAGLAPGEPIVVQGPDHPDTIEAILGAFLAGGVVVPLEESTQAPFRDLVTAKVSARLLVAPRSIEPPAGCRLLPLGGFGTADRFATTPHETAEIVFTSGTTGEPKGVVLTHANLAADFAPLEHGFRKHEAIATRIGELVVLSSLPLSHMFGQAMNLFVPLYMGLTVALVPPRPRDILDAASRVGAWGLFTVPRLLELMAAEMRRFYADPRDRARLEERLERHARRPFWMQAFLFRRLRRQLGRRFLFVVSGGAALTDPVRNFWERAGYLVIQGYGLTETAPIISISNPFRRGQGGVGKALAGQEVRLGPDGEIWVRGANVTPGYFGATPGAATSAAPGAAPGAGASLDPEAGWLKTGDVGVIDADGQIQIKGRLKEVIVTPEGENVYVADVESGFAGLPGLRDVAVFGWPYEGGERVHAALILAPGAVADEVVARANERLLAKQRVRDYTVWPESDFPRTPTGKIRRLVLRERAVALRQSAGGTAPAPAAAGGVRRVVAQVARVPADRLQAGTRLVEDLGLASLDLVELAAALEQEFGLTLAEDRMATATVGDLEAAAHAALDGVTATPGAGAARVTTGDTTASVAVPTDMAAADDDPPPAVASRSAAPGSGRLHPPPLMPRWARRPPWRWLRRFLEEALYRPFVFAQVRVDRVGFENLRAIDGPCLVVSNHHSYLDTGLFKTVLPRPLRGRIAPGMTTRYHRVYFGETPGSWWQYGLEGFQTRLVQFFFNAWPLPETAGFRSSLVYAGEMADAGWSILVFPEGRHVHDGSMEAFRGGIGLVARELRAPILPIHVEGTGYLLPDDRYWLRLGRARVAIGAPFTVAPDETPAEITRRIEAAVRALAPPGTLFPKA